jgi:hypothetical protein
VGRVQKFYVSKLSRASIKLEHTKDEKTFYRFMQQEAHKGPSDLANRLTHQGQNNVEN